MRGSLHKGVSYCCLELHTDGTDGQDALFGGDEMFYLTGVELIV